MMIAIEPGVGALPVAVSCVADTNVVGRAVLPKKTCEPEAKLLPVTVSVKLPTVTEVGAMLLMNGADDEGRNERVVESDLVVSATLVALTVTDDGEGIVAGAV
jgi:hypothetical protein